ncbi:secretin and TonB N-terminal domain-containing protein [Hymenobacter sp. YC55]|uniref:secretin and TonB N-terminal domain-containing protein n=1 Tax=Hymenobacter sp. YC55 TaxID=3034019 RepID=UPI0023F6B86D|nr:secretin and TonB N-terminal domain-containing protein [Hymenobacter sp. YC55]MDF7814736.1 DUF4974 domain-containing protein [Hymenobacter sp. YC55]
MLNRICLAVALFFSLAGQPALSQGRPGSVLDRKVTVVFNQAPLESVLRTLRRQYGLRISYSNTALNLQQPVTLNVQNQSLRAVLNTVLADKNIGYELVGDQVVLHPARKEKPQSAPNPGTSSAGKASSTDSGPSSSPAGSSATVSATNSTAAGGKLASTTPAKRRAAKPTAGKPTTPKSPGVGVASSGRGPTTGAQVAEKKVAVRQPITSPATDSSATAGAKVSAPVASDSVAPAKEPEELARPTLTKKAQISFLGPLGSNGLRSGQTVNKMSLNVLGGYAAGVDGFEAAGLFNVDRDTVAGTQLAGLANIVGRHLDGFQGAGLMNVVAGGGTGWQAAGLLNVATRPLNGVQTAGLFNYSGLAKGRPASDNQSQGTESESGSRHGTVQAAGLFNVSPEVRGVQAAGLFNAAGTVHGVQLAGLFNVADSVDGVSIAPFNFVRRGYHRVEAVSTESWPVGLALKLGGSPQFYTFLAGTYDGFGSGNRRWALGYGVGTEMLARHRLSVNLDALALQVNEAQRGWTDDLNLHNQLRLLVGLAPFKAGGHFRFVAGPTVSVLVTQRYDAETGQIHSNLSDNRRLWLNQGSAATRVLGWFGYCAGVRF